MEDRFKVRAWNNRTKEYVNEKGINTIYKGAYNATMLLGLFQYLKDDKQIQAIAKDFEFEQCTGLKDKYGNLIYEGDIIRGVWKDVKIKYVVKFHKCNAQFILEIPNEDSFGEFDILESDHLEIIGNIHENPELLEAE